jgi:hypothetical protein
MRKLILAIVALSTQLPAHAAEYCYGTITEFLTYSDGSVMIYPTWRGSWVGVCNLNTPWKGVPALTCAAWYTTIKTAVSRQPLPQTIIYYPDTSSSCSSMPIYLNAPAPGYIMLKQ